MRNIALPTMSRLISPGLFSILFLFLFNDAFGQAEAEPWGNMTGIRRDGQLFDFESAIKIQKGDRFVSTGKERQRPHFKRDGDEQIINTNIDSLFIKEVVKDESNGKASVTVTFYAHADISFDNLFFTLALPAKEYGDGSTKLAGVHDEMRHYVNSGQNYDGTANGAQFKSAASHLEIKFDSPDPVRIRKDVSNTNDLQLYVSLKQNGLTKGDSLQKTFTIEVSGKIDKKTVDLDLNTSTQGRRF